MYSNRIDLIKIFTELPYAYCIMRIPEHFPNYYEHSDIDVLCRDARAIADYLRLNFPSSRVFPISNKWHVDTLLSTGKLDLKFDLMDNFLCYEKIGIKPEFLDYVFKNLTEKKKVIVPNDDCEFVLRYIEYNEYIDSRPEKVKHLKYIQDNATSDKYKELLSEYTTLRI